MALTKLTTDLDNIQALSDKPNEIEGLTADELKAKWDKAGGDIKTYINDTLTVEQDAINTTHTPLDVLNSTSATSPLSANQGKALNDRLSTTETLIGQDGSSHTTIGTNDVRATRFVPLATPNRIVSGVDPTGTGFTLVDATSVTSNNCYAITGNCDLVSATAGRALYMRTYGDSTGASTAMQKANVPSAGVYGFSAFSIGVDDQQRFEYSVSNADVSAVDISITGYWEYVD